jgi:hypothetical protein
MERKVNNYLGKRVIAIIDTKNCPINPLEALETVGLAPI